MRLPVIQQDIEIGADQGRIAQEKHRPDPVGV